MRPRRCSTLGVPAVLLKGGHLPGDTVVDLLATEEGIEEFAAPRIDTPPHARHRLHARERDRGRAGAGNGPCGRGRSGTGLRAGGDRERRRDSAAATAR